MKYTYLLLLLISFNASAQTKGDKKIIVSVSDTANLFSRLALSFLEKGYTLENKDQQLGFLSTKEKSLEKLGASTRMKALIKENSIIFSGDVASDVEMKIWDIKMERTFLPLEYRNNKSAFGYGWKRMEEIAKEFGTLSYSK